MRTWPARYRDYFPYLLGLVGLFCALSLFKLFWRSNDDVALAMIADGTGPVGTPSPHLILTNIAWGYLVYGVHSLGVVHAYALMTYLALALSYAALLYALARRRIQHWVAATVLLLLYLPVLVLPQHTLVAGYLAFAGIVLLCRSIESGSLRDGGIAAGLLVVSSLVRWDETAFVGLVALPFCFRYLGLAWKSPQRRRWLWLLAITAGLGLGFLLIDFLSFGRGDWKLYADTYKSVMEFNDFRIGRYFTAHREALAGSGFSSNDVELFGNWFYCDTQVFDPARIAALLDRVPSLDRLRLNLAHAHRLVEPLDDPALRALALMVLGIGVFHSRRWHLALSVLVLGLLMLLLLVLGRPQITRIYLPALAALVALGLLELEIRARTLAAAAVAGLLLVNFSYLKGLHHDNQMERLSASRLRSATCKLDPTQLIVSWGGFYPFTRNYSPFGDPGACQLNNYALGEFSLAPFALEHLHKFTGGKDLVPAILAGQSFDFVAAGPALKKLNRYFQEHYSVRLHMKRVPHRGAFPLVRVGLADLPAAAPGAAPQQP